MNETDELFIDTNSLDELAAHLTTNFSPTKLFPKEWYGNHKGVDELSETASQLEELTRTPNKDDIELIMHAGKTAYDMGDFEAAAHNFIFGLTIDNENPELYLHLGRVFMGKGKYASANALFKKGREVDKSKKFSGEFNAGLSGVSIKQTEWNRKHLKEEDRLFIDEGNLDRLTVHLFQKYDGEKLFPHNYISEDRHIDHESKRALDLELLLRTSEHPEIKDWVEYGDIMFANRDYQTAFHVFVNILNLDRENPGAYLYLGRMFMDAGKYESAGALLREGKRINSSEEIDTEFDDYIFINSTRKAELPAGNALIEHLIATGRKTKKGLSGEELKDPEYDEGLFGENGFYGACNMLAANPEDPAPYHIIGKFFEKNNQKAAARTLFLRGMDYTLEKADDRFRSRLTFLEDMTHVAKDKAEYDIYRSQVVSMRRK